MLKTSSKKASCTIFLIFGGTGDLTKRKIMPALYNLFLDNWLPENFAIIGSSSSEMSDDKYKSELLSAVTQFSRNGKPKKEDWAKFSSHITFQSADITDPSAFKPFGGLIENYKKEWDKTPSIIYYCAVAPRFFSIIAENISKSKLENDPETTRIIVEKPFGSDLESAKELNQKPPSKKVNPILMGITWRLSVLWSVLTFTRPLITKSAAHNAFSTTKYSNQKIKKALDYQFYTLEESVENAVKGRII